MLFLPLIALIVLAVDREKQSFFSVIVFRTVFLYSLMGNSWLEEKRSSALVSSLVQPSYFSFLYSFNIYLLSAHFVLGTVPTIIIWLELYIVVVCTRYYSKFAT